MVLCRVYHTEETYTWLRNLLPVPNLSPKAFLFLSLAANMAAIPLAISLSSDAAWYFEDIKQRGTIAALCWVCCMLVSYRQLAFKSVAALAACYFTADVLTWPLWMWAPSTYDITPYFTTITAACLALWYWFRSYHWPSDTPEPGMVYLCRRRPAKPQDLLMAMLGRQPLGGISVMIDGQVWAFHHGVLQRMDGLTDLSRYVIMGTRRADTATVATLTALEGTRWTLIHNCVTVLLPVAVRAA